MPGLRQLFFLFSLKTVLPLKGLGEHVSCMQEEAQTIVSVSSMLRWSKHGGGEVMPPWKKMQVTFFHFLKSTPSYTSPSIVHQ